MGIIQQTETTPTLCLEECLSMCRIIGMLSKCRRFTRKPEVSFYAPTAARADASAGCETPPPPRLMRDGASFHRKKTQGDRRSNEAGISRRQL